MRGWWPAPSPSCWRRSCWSAGARGSRTWRPPPCARRQADVAAVPADSKLLDESVGDVAFPNYAAKFGWKAVGTRTDEINGRKTRTVFYEKDGKRIAYTIVDGKALDAAGRRGDRHARGHRAARR